jgi:GTPase SAR1 family protein
MAPRLPHQEKYASMVLLMGSTGSGKSVFANKLKEGATIESDSLYSCTFYFFQSSLFLDFNLTLRNICTATCQVIQTKIGRTSVAVVDCPGFNDTNRSDTEVLGGVAKLLSSQYLVLKNLRLRGILYFRDIAKMRMEGSDVRTLNLLARLVGKEAFAHIVSVTTRWESKEVEDQKLFEKRERQLKDKFWREMIMEGSYLQRFHGTKDSAEGIVSQIVGAADPVVLRIQHELIEKDIDLAATAAGSVLAPLVEEKLVESESKLQRFKALLARETNSTVKTRVMMDIKKAEQERDQALSDKNKLKEKVGFDLKSKIRENVSWQDALKTICSVLGLGLTIVLQVAPTCAIQ